MIDPNKSITGQKPQHITPTPRAWCGDGAASPAARHLHIERIRAVHVDHHDAPGNGSGTVAAPRGAPAVRDRLHNARPDFVVPVVLTGFQAGPRRRDLRERRRPGTDCPQAPRDDDLGLAAAVRVGLGG